MPVLIFYKHLKLYAWILSPFIAVVPASLFCVYLYHIPINYDVLVVIYNTNPAEAYEFARGYMWYFIIFLVFYLFFYIKLIERLPREVSLKVSLIMSMAGLALFCVLSLFNDQPATYAAKLKEGVTRSSFGGLTYSVSNLVKNIRIASRHKELVKDFKFNARQKQNVAGRQVYVLIIGESSRAKSWQILGYNRETSPNLAKKDSQLVKFDNVCSGGYITNLAVPLYLTRATPDNYDQHFHEKSIVAAFNEAGFKTYWLSNQSNFQDVAMLTEEASEKVYLPSDYTFTKNVHMDMKLLPLLKSVLANADQKSFIVLHTLGSHYRYSARYPEEYNFFRPSTKTNLVNPTDYTKSKYIINSYDNTIRYTDALISQVIDMIRQTDATSSVSYISDHGEDMFDDERRLSQHIHPVPSKYIAHVPLFVWLSPKYRSVFPDKVSNLKSHEHSPIGSQNIFFSLMDIGNITYPQIDSAKSITSPAFKGGVQRILGGGGKVYKYSDLK
ncbi:MAG: hypothetical protein K0S09_2235 [Sphingobacteriaceae bacterium]|nr:hypothetical protein [Sphingobacteriaceae bacterium]